MENLAAAEAHLEGLIALISIAKSLRRQNRGAHLVEGDKADRAEFFLERYVIICMKEITRARTRAMGITAAGQSAGEQICGNKVDDQPLALWMIPYFLIASQDLPVDEDIKNTDFLDDLRLLTVRYGGCCRPRPGSTTYASLYSSPADSWQASGDGVDYSILYLWGVTKNGVALYMHPSRYSEDEVEEAYRCSWTSLSVAVGLYIHGPLGLPWPQQAIRGRPMHWLLHVLQWDLDELEESLTASTEGRNLWFWKIFVGISAFSNTEAAARAAERRETTAAGRAISPAGNGVDPADRALKVRFYKRIRLWAKIAGVTEWEEAKDALASIVWPATGEELAVAVWNEALGKPLMRPE